MLFQRELAEYPRCCQKNSLQWASHILQVVLHRILIIPIFLDIVEALSSAIVRNKNGDVIGPQVMHKRIAEIYQWDDVARRTVNVYESIPDNHMTIREGFNK